MSKLFNRTPIPKWFEEMTQIPSAFWSGHWGVVVGPYLYEMKPIKSNRGDVLQFFRGSFEQDTLWFPDIGYTGVFYTDLTDEEINTNGEPSVSNPILSGLMLL